MSQNYGIIPAFRSTKISLLSKTRPAVHYIFFVLPFGAIKKDAVSIGARMEGVFLFEGLKMEVLKTGYGITQFTGVFCIFENYCK